MAEYNAGVGDFGEDLLERERLKRFVESHPNVPIMVIIRCLIQIEEETGYLVDATERTVTAAGLAVARLEELDARYLAEAGLHPERARWA